MKKIIIILALLPLLGLSQEVKSKISLAGNELLEYQDKQLISRAMMLGGAGLIAFSTLKEEHKPLLYLGGILFVYSVKVDIESLFNLRKSAKHLKGIQ